MTRGKPVTQLNGKKAKRERERTKVINQKMKNLADCLPIVTKKSNYELSKMDTLKLATEYIKTLRMILNEEDDMQNQLPMFPEHQPKVRLASREEILGLILSKEFPPRAEGSPRQAEIDPSYDETSDPERFFKELDESLKRFSSSSSSPESSTSPDLMNL
ncbi:hypothetical protein B9Z55_007538 [Caenorhabditis nigoni]|uniref:BHLH domain-containing protein n=1 Tax=Caenorhabditis nigoni TaxID=1611254 RepID=A0A2G5VA45_9PELO|nr:hypothetical protein B9Z55_007538 [Caenorhabditis nigoni]